MEPHCPDCCSPEVGPDSDRSPDDRLCGNCGARFHRDSILVTLADAEIYAEEHRACTCSEARGCPQCFQRADELLGVQVRDHLGREWEVHDVGEKNGFPTISGSDYWDYPNEVSVAKGVT